MKNVFGTFKYNKELRELHQDEGGQSSGFKVDAGYCFFVKFHFIDETTTKKKRKNMYFQWDQVEIWWKFDGNFHL